MDEIRRKRFTDTLTQPYDHDKYILFLQELLNEVELASPKKPQAPYNTFSAAVNGYYHIGTFTGKNGNKVALFSVELKNDKNLENARSMQRNFVKSLLEDASFQGALVAFYTKGEPDKWRLSLVRLDYEFAQGKLSEKVTPAKRYSFLVGQGEPCHTAQQQLLPIFADEDSNPSLDDLEAAFSVEAVTDDFFRQYKEKFLQLKESLDSNESFRAEAGSRGFTSEQFAKKLMGQIVFLYFVQKKGWLGVGAFPAELRETDYKHAFFAPGQKPKQLMPLVYTRTPEGNYRRNGKAIMGLSEADQIELSRIVRGNKWGSGPKDFMRQLFKVAEDRHKNYFDDFLEPLFYTGLNQNRGENAYFVPLNCRIPFLNGGLFEQLDGYDWEDNDFSIPNEIFSNIATKGPREADGILDIFDRYNFTMAEDEPMEREIAIDPEMLGKVFENLLDVRDRKSKGAFYTPREIVHFMCQETLINYLVNKTGIAEDDIRKFILYGEYFCDEDTKKTKFVQGVNGKKGHYEYDPDKKLEIPESLYTFQMGTKQLENIDALLDSVKVADLAVGSGAFPLGMLNEIVKARTTITAYMAIGMDGLHRLQLHADRSPYRLKRDAIKNSIFACDIEPSATDITKLRLWLSLVIDDQIKDKKDELLGYDTKPRELPNLDCNIICGNSLMDEFGGIKFITENKVLGNEADCRQTSLYDSELSVKIQSLIDLQSKLYDEKDHVEKNRLKNQIQDIYNEIILKQLESNPELTDKYFQTITQASKPFVLWQLYFPKVFRDNGGFDIVIGNPPYGLINKKQNQQLGIQIDDYTLEYYKNEPMYSPAKGGMINIFRLFICKSFSVLRKDGHLSLIFPMAFMCDLSAAGLRKYVLEKNKVNYLEAFPERDNENKRVFKSAKISVCILGAQKTKKDKLYKFPVRINQDRYVDTSKQQVYMSLREIELIDKKHLTIPLVSSADFSILVKMCSDSKRMGDFSKCYTGEIDLSINKKYIRLDNTYEKMLRGAQVQKFYITNKISQGDIYYLDAKQYLDENHSPKSKHHCQNRIVMQGITGVNEKFRLKMAIAEKGIFCANSVNYLLTGDDTKLILGLCNSKLLNWFFAKLSTNSNVNGYEIDNLPIKVPNQLVSCKLIDIVDKLLDDPFKQEYVNSLDTLVYNIYDLTEEEIKTIEDSYC